MLRDALSINSEVPEYGSARRKVAFSLDEKSLGTAPGLGGFREEKAVNPFEMRFEGMRAIGAKPSQVHANRARKQMIFSGCIFLLSV
jgi:hypothetical protein